MKKLSYRLSIPAILLLSASYLQGNTIKEVVEHTMSTNPKISASLKNNDAYKLYIDEAKGGFYPKVDLTAYVGTKKTKTDPNIGNNTTANTDGVNAQLDLEQLIYDGGLTSGQVDEAEFRYSSNKYLNDTIIDDIIYDSVEDYLNLVKYKNKVAITKESLVIYDDYYTIAKDTEEISGEALHKAQVNAKVHFAKNSLYDNMNNNLQAVSSFKKNVGMEPDGKSCRPNIDGSKMPSTLKQLIDNVVVSNSSILEQVENIKEQRAILNQRDANFYPTIKFKAQGIYDDDLLTQDESTEIYSARIELTYNLFNGNKDKKSSLREKRFLEEAQTTLDSVTKDVIDSTTTAYNTYMFSKKREVELYAYIKDNQDVLSFYKDQFESGTRTFIDVLNIERDLVNAKQDLVDVQFDIDTAYFQVFNNLSTLKESILNSNNYTCTENKVEKMQAKPMMKKETVSEDVEALLDDGAAVKENMLDTSATTGNTVYALYLVAYKNVNSAQRALEDAQGILTDKKVKIEKAGSYNSIVVYDIETKDELNNIKDQTKAKFPGGYIRKFNR